MADALALGSANLVYWSPFNGDLALATDRNINLVPLSQPDVQPQALGAAPSQAIPADQPTILAGAQASPRLAWVDAANTIHALDSSSPGSAMAVGQGEKAVTGLAVAPQGDRLAFSTSDGSLAVVAQLDRPGSQSQQNFTLPSWLTNLAYSPDGKLIGGANAPNFQVYILDAQTGKVLRTLDWIDSPSPNLYGVFFSPDWTRVAWVAQAAVQLMNVGDGSKGPLLNHQDHVNVIAWSPDSKRLATVSTVDMGAGPVAAVLIWDAASGSQISVLPQAGAVLSLAFSPDGKQIATIDGSQNLQVWNLER